MENGKKHYNLEIALNVATHCWPRECFCHIWEIAKIKHFAKGCEYGQGAI
jgi:hypothetical protein